MRCVVVVPKRLVRHREIALGRRAVAQFQRGRRAADVQLRSRPSLAELFAQVDHGGEQLARLRGPAKVQDRFREQTARGDLVLEEPRRVRFLDDHSRLGLGASEVAAEPRKPRQEESGLSLHAAESLLPCQRDRPLGHLLAEHEIARPDHAADQAREDARRHGRLARRDGFVGELEATSPHLPQLAGLEEQLHPQHLGPNGNT